MTQYRLRTLALLSSLLLHLLFLLVTWNMDFIRIDEADLRNRVNDAVELFLVPDPTGALEDGRPTAYTSVPERHEAAMPPDTPDFLALRHSQAADLLPGGEEDSSPAASEESEVTQVAINRFEPGPAASGVTIAEVPEATDAALAANALERAAALRGEVADPTGPADSRAGDPDATRQGDQTETLEAQEEPADAKEPGEAQETLADLPQRSTPSILETLPGATGDEGFDYRQAETGSTAGNMVRFGEYQLNTVAWEFAPWLEQFRRDFLPNWIPPYAYMLGVIDGMTTLRLVVELDGTIGALETLDEQGHPSLHQASIAALRSAAPYAPLPEDFPEENLVIILSLHYPAWSQ